MPSFQTTVSAFIVVWLATAAAGSNAVAEEPAAGAGAAPAASIGTAPADDGSALFNPFAGASAPRVQPRGADAARQGDLALPLLAAVAGFATIAALMWKIIG
jgi:hypothetical protein